MNTDRDKNKMGETLLCIFMCIITGILFIVSGSLGYEMGKQSTEKYYLKQLIDRNLAEYNPKTGKIEWVKQMEIDK